MRAARHDFEVELLAKHDRSTFSCGVEVLDRYFRERASQDARRRVAAPFVMIERASKRIAGYYTLSNWSVKGDDIPPELVKTMKLPRYPHVPVTLIGRLARDRRFLGRGVGEILLFDALERALVSSTQVASAGVIVDALDDRAAAFYRKYGFQSFRENPLRLFLPMQTIETSFFSKG